jgi:hypothetical protein
MVIMKRTWLSLGEASSVLGISVRRLYGRVVDGEFATQEHRGRHYLLIDVPSRKIQQFDDSAKQPEMPVVLH